MMNSQKGCINTTLTLDFYSASKAKRHKVITLSVCLSDCHALLLLVPHVFHGH